MGSAFGGLSLLIQRSRSRKPVHRHLHSMTTNAPWEAFASTRVASNMAGPYPIASGLPDCVLAELLVR